MGRLHLSRRFLVAAATAIAMLAATTAGRAQLDNAFFDAVTHPSIGYLRQAPADPIARLARAIADGTLTLKFDPESGYLPALLEALNIPLESQLAVFSKTSLQSPLIDPGNPRAIYFNDSVVVAWPRGGFIEIAAQDPQQGTMFYLLPQAQVSTPQFVRSERCLSCHLAYPSMNVPGPLVRSVVADRGGRTAPQLGNYVSDHRSPLAERWAGWYVTGRSGSAAHLGNTIIRDSRDPAATAVAQSSSLASLDDLFDGAGYLTRYSDIVALLVFDHQMHAMNLLTRVGWEVRVALVDRRPEVEAIAAAAAGELADYFLFVDEAPLASAIQGSSGFAGRFSAQGPRDSKGRSLRQLNLQQRLLRYPCSYMIYSDAFDQLPGEAKSAVYRRLWQVLSGEEKDRRYERLSAADRQAVLEILRETKTDLPDYWK